MFRCPWPFCRFSGACAFQHAQGGGPAPRRRRRTRRRTRPPGRPPRGGRSPLRRGRASKGRGFVGAAHWTELGGLEVHSCLLDGAVLAPRLLRQCGALRGALDCLLGRRAQFGRALQNCAERVGVRALHRERPGLRRPLLLSASGEPPHQAPSPSASHQPAAPQARRASRHAKPSQPSPWRGRAVSQVVRVACANFAL